MEEDKIGPAKRLIAIGGSAGSLDVLLRTIPKIPLSSETAIVLVLHRLANTDAQLTTVLSAKTKWTVKEADDKDVLLAGSIYIAPGGYHLLIEKDGTCTLDYSEKVNYSRPAIDPTFETAAEAYGPALKCLLLSGANADGVEGIKAVVRAGGTIAIQDPGDAQVPYMPEQARIALPDIRVLSMKEIVGYLGS